jgi:hypothetical protein
MVVPNVASGVYPYVIATGEQATNILYCFTFSGYGHTAPSGLFWRGKLSNTTTPPLALPADDFTLVSNSLVTAAATSPAGITVSEYLMRLSNNLPVAFAGTNAFVFGNNLTRQPTLIRTTRGGVFILAYRQDYDTGMDFDWAYRLPDGHWQISHFVPQSAMIGVSTSAGAATAQWTSVSNANHALSQSLDSSGCNDVTNGIYGEAGIASQGAVTARAEPSANPSAFFAVKTRGCNKRLLGVAKPFVERIFGHTPLFPKSDGLYFPFVEAGACDAGTWQLNKLDYATGQFGEPVTVITNVAPAQAWLARGADIPNVAWQDNTDLTLHIDSIAGL